jgi:hypothetical protein
VAAKTTGAGVTEIEIVAASETQPWEEVPTTVYVVVVDGETVID